MNKAVILMVLIMILAFLFTAGLIVNSRIYQFHQNKQATQIVKEEEEEVEKKPLTDVTLYEEYHLPINDDAKGATSSQRFDINPIKISEHIYEDEKTYAYYLQIDGLINILTAKLSHEMCNCDVEEQRRKFGIECDMTEEDLMKVRNLGRKSLKEIKTKLEDIGLGLKKN